MNPKTIRFRLTAIYSLVLIVSVAVSFAVFFMVTRRQLYAHTDMLLTSHAARITNILEQEQWQLGGELSARTLTDIYSDVPGMLVFVTDTAGHATSVSQSVTDLEPTVKALFATARTSTSPRFTDRTVSGNAMRFIVVPILVDNTSRGMVMVGHPIDVINKSLTSLVGSLTAVLFLFVIPAVYGGYFLAGRALTPIADIGRQMRGIGSSDLTRRVANPETGDELEDLAVTFNNLLSRIEEAFKSERQFIGDMAHELKTPLATMRGSIDIALSRGRTNAQYQSTLRELQIDADRLSSTLTGILDLAWSNAESLNPSSDRTDLSGIVTDVGEIAQKLAVPFRSSVILDVEPDLAVRGKKDQLFRAILNIADNAVKYGGRNGTITIRATSRRGIAVVIIRDRGPGIPRTDLPHVFDRYYRGHRAPAGGTGLGLAIAKAVISACDGTIGISSSRNGTAVSVELPLYGVQAPATEA